MSSQRIKIFKIILFIPFLIVVLFTYYTVKTSRMERKRASMNQHIGQKFPQLLFVDADKRLVLPDLSHSDITIIDFWYKNCPGCIEEMQEFEQLLKGKEEKLSIISVSVDSYADWNRLM